MVVVKFILMICAFYGVVFAQNGKPLVAVNVYVVDGEGKLLEM